MPVRAEEMFDRDLGVTGECEKISGGRKPGASLPVPPGRRRDTEFLCRHALLEPTLQTPLAQNGGEPL